MTSAGEVYAFGDCSAKVSAERTHAAEGGGNRSAGGDRHDERDATSRDCSLWAATLRGCDDERRAAVVGQREFGQLGQGPPGIHRPRVTLKAS